MASFIRNRIYHSVYNNRLLYQPMTNFNDILKQYQSILYLIGRIFALFIFGPYLVYIGNKMKNSILVYLGILLILWDGAKLGIQIYYNDFSY
jgi:hypothetical protein